MPPTQLQSDAAFEAVAQSDVEAWLPTLGAGDLMGIERDGVVADEGAGDAGDGTVDIDESAKHQRLTFGQIPLFHVEEFARGVKAAVLISRMAQRPHERTRNDLVLSESPGGPCQQGQGRHDCHEKIFQ